MTGVAISEEAKHVFIDVRPSNYKFLKSKPKVFGCLWAMATKISALQPSGQTLVLEVTPETTGRELKQQIKQGQPWDELTRSTTSVEVIVGDNHLLANDAKVFYAGIAEDSVVSVVFKPNKMICSNRDAIDALKGIVDSELLFVVEIPHGETEICESAFADCSVLASLINPDSVTHIQNDAFRDCSSLVNLTIPNSVTHIGDYAFLGCRSLANLSIPNSVTHIGDGAFGFCISLKTLTVPRSVTHLGEEVFFGCSEEA